MSIGFINKGGFNVRQLEEKCLKIRKDLINFIYRIGMGHLGGELSMVELVVGLYYKYLN
jgi:transketolase